jgi:polysaccharide biosynthesis protein PslH
VRILIVVDEPPLPPPVSGLRLVLQRVLEGALADHEVRVVALDGPREGPDPAWLRIVPPSGGVATAARCWGRFLLRRRPLHADAYVHDLRAAVEEELRDFDPDVVHLFSDELASLRPTLGRRPAIMSPLDAPHLNADARASLRRGPARWALRQQAARLRRYVAVEYPAYDAVVFVTPQDAEAVRALAPTVETRVISNGVDTTPFAGSWAGAGRPRMTFHGAMHWAPNVDAAVWAAREVLPRVRRRLPDAELVLVGWEPAPEVLELRELPGVVVTGAVDEVAPWLHGTGVYLCPMRQGTGIKNKLLEAMAAGAPCVASPLAMQGIAAEAGTDVLVAADADGLARHAVRVLEDRGLAEELGRRGRAVVREHHSWESTAQSYLELYEDVSRSENSPFSGRRGPVAG